MLIRGWAAPADVHRGADQLPNHDVMAEIARDASAIATGERVFTKWGFVVLEKQAATIPQPDLCHAG
jgi:galactonate dehydratase